MHPVINGGNHTNYGAVLDFRFVVEPAVGRLCPVNARAYSPQLTRPCTPRFLCLRSVIAATPALASFRGERFGPISPAKNFFSSRWHFRGRNFAL